MTENLLIDAAGIRLAGLAAGPVDGPVLVLLHGLGLGAADFADVLPELAADRRVLALDLRGHGGSDRPGAYTLDLLCGDVLAALDALGPARVDLLGHSMGGVVAYLLAGRHPERVRRLVLEDVPAPHPREEEPALRPDGPLAFDWELVPALRRELYAPPAEWAAALAAVTAPTLVIAGGPTSHLPQDRVAELADTVPDGRVHTVPVGHLVHQAAPAEFTRLVLDFLTESAN
ncbi:alpha/beta fold hydrolase [Kitasatospora griseola]|uniref:alpha/beta fold hydrolase n=1 Tax=Kitasatospora griseola TaxID=2064 RepID=UPI00380F6794